MPLERLESENDVRRVLLMPRRSMPVHKRYRRRQVRVVLDDVLKVGNGFSALIDSIGHHARTCHRIWRCSVDNICDVQSGQQTDPVEILIEMRYHEMLGQWLWDSTCVVSIVRKTEYRCKETTRPRIETIERAKDAESKHNAYGPNRVPQMHGCDPSLIATIRSETTLH